MQRDRWFHRGVALTRLPSIILVTHLTTPDKPALSVLMKLTDDHEDRPSRAATKKHRAAESVLRRLLGSFLIRAWVACTTLPPSSLKSAVRRRPHLRALGGRVWTMHFGESGTFLSLHHSGALRAGRMAYDRCRLLKVRTATIIPGLAYNSQDGFQVRGSIQLNT